MKKAQFKASVPEEDCRKELAEDMSLQARIAELKAERDHYMKYEAMKGVGNDQERI